MIDANDGLFEFLGYSREEFSAMGSRMSAVIHPEDMPDVTERISEQLRHGSTVHSENRLVCKDGSIKWVSVKGQMFQEKDGAQFFSTVFVYVE